MNRQLTEYRAHVTEIVQCNITLNYTRKQFVGNNLSTGNLAQCLKIIKNGKTFLQEYLHY